MQLLVLFVAFGFDIWKLHTCGLSWIDFCFKLLECFHEFASIGIKNYSLCCDC